MRDVISDWKRWSRIERMVAIAWLCTLVLLPAWPVVDALL